MNTAYNVSVPVFLAKVFAYLLGALIHGLVSSPAVLAAAFVVMVVCWAIITLAIRLVRACWPVAAVAGALYVARLMLGGKL